MEQQQRFSVAVDLVIYFDPVYFRVMTGGGVAPIMDSRHDTLARYL
jgi:hypothetical protein